MQGNPDFLQMKYYLSEMMLNDTNGNPNRKGVIRSRSGNVEETKRKPVIGRVSLENRNSLTGLDRPKWSIRRNCKKMTQTSKAMDYFFHVSGGHDRDIGTSRNAQQTTRIGML
jgi:hypothetical protein